MNRVMNWNYYKLFTSQCHIFGLDVVGEVLILDVVAPAHHKHNGVVEGRLHQQTEWHL